MKKLAFLSAVLFGLSAGLTAQLKPGDNAVLFTLKNVDSKMVSLTDYKDQKGVIVIFTCNPCPFSVAYENRIIALHKNYVSAGYHVIAINPNDEEISPDDTFEKMKQRAKDKNFPFPYLKDETQEIYKAYGATRTPHVYLLKNENGKFKVAFIGAIDDNALDEKGVSKRYVDQVIRALETGVKVSPDEVKVIGCTIKTKG